MKNTGKQRRDFETRFKVKGDRPMGSPVSVALPLEIDALVRTVPNRSEWLRRVICEAVERELMNQGDNAKPKS